MSKQVKDLLTLGAAALLVLTLSLWGIFKSDDAVSESERRPLKQFPLFSAQEVLSGRFQSNFESYTLDQFPLRDAFRTLKALSVRYLFGEKDNNGIYMAGGYAAKLDDTIREDSLDHAADRFRYVYETYLKDTGANIYLSVIPDKNCFLAAENGYPAMDYDRFLALMREKVDFAQFVDLTDTLSLGSYYRTDLHWRQEALLPTAQALADAMGVSLTEDFTEVTLLRIENPNAKTERKLIVFRDSFGASLIPLLAEGYREITLIDIRYLSPASLGRFVDFDAQDVLFLYSTSVLNDSATIK